MHTFSKKVLVVEDDKILRLTILSQLKRLLYIGFAIDNGATVVAELEKETYDLVMMDVQMPGVSGLEAVAAIRAWEKKERRKRIPIIGVTANPNRAQCFEAGMDDFMFKPYCLGDLAAMMQKWSSEKLSA